MKTSNKIVYLSHGGGPLPLLGDEGHKEMVECLQSVTSKIGKPSAIIVISAHWEDQAVTITSGANPPLIYDYYGFPEEAYSIEYPCPGEPVLARQIYELLRRGGVEAHLDDQRGFDHGLYVPLKIMYPDADIPCVQISLLNSLDPAEHLKIGGLLRELDNENFLIVGSGFSFHNMQEFFAPETEKSKAKNEAFDNWLLETLSSKDMTEEGRAQRLISWETAPAARFCHPREEHLLPLHVCYGLAQRCCLKSYTLQILKKRSSMYLW